MPGADRNDPDTLRDARFTDEEAREILARAVNAEVRARADAADEHTLARLTEAAGEVGVSPEHVRQAASAVALERSRLQSDRMSTAREVAVHRGVAASMSNATWGSVVRLLREEFGDVGSTAQFDASCEWIGATSMARAGPISVRIERASGVSLVRIQQDVSGWRNWPRLAAIGASVIALAATIAIFLLGADDLWVIRAGLWSFALAMYPAGRSHVDRVIEQQRARFARVLDAVEYELLRAPPPATQPPGHTWIAPGERPAAPRGDVANANAAGVGGPGDAPSAPTPPNPRTSA